MDVRPLRAGEEGALLDLLARWPASDDWAMRELLGRYVEDEPQFDPRDVWVATDGGALVSCVQIFPRRIAVRGKSIPVGGIGSVFTDPGRRGRGAAAAVLRAVADDLRGRGFELGLLFAGPVPFYEALGWQSWPVERPLWRAMDAEAAAGALGRTEPFERARDLAEVQALHAGYSQLRDGTCLRDDARWWTNLRHAGNPGEEFRVVRVEGRLVAYLRAVCLGRFLVLMEWGRSEGAVEALADLFAAALVPRADDPIAPRARPSPEFRALASSPPLLDPALARALAGRGLASTPSEDRGSMFFVSAPEALAHRFGEPYRGRSPGDLTPPGQSEVALLRRILPPARFAFWPADRF